MFLDRRFLQNKLLSSSSFTPLDTLNLNREKSLKLMSSPYTLSPILAVLLAACGGGGTVRVPVYLTDPDNQNPRPDGPGEPPVRPDGPGVGPGGDGDFNAQPFDIFVADGIIEGARVYVDINGNGQIDEGDVLIGTTDQTGAVRNIPGEYAGEQILADVAGALDLFTGETIPDGIVYRAKVNEFGRDDVVLSPISTAIADIVEALMAIEQQLTEEEATEQAFLRLFGANSGVTEEHLNDPDSFILPTDAAPKPLQSPGGIREKIATAAIKLQLLMEETPETEERIAKLIDADGFTDDDLQNPGTSTDRVNTARSIAQGKPLASPDADRGENPGNIDEDNALLIDVADWGFRDPVGNVNQEVSALVQLRIVGIELTRDDGSVLRGNAVGKLVLADGTDATPNIDVADLEGLRFVSFQNIYGQVRISYRLFDGEQDSNQKDLVLEITSVNDAPVDILLTGDRENGGADRADSVSGGDYILVDGKILLADGREAGDLSATDPAFGEDDERFIPFTDASYSFSGQHGDLFTVINGVLQLKPGATAITPGEYYEFTITVTDSDGASYSENYRIKQGGLYLEDTANNVRTYNDGDALINEEADGNADEDAQITTDAINLGSLGVEGLHTAEIGTQGQAGHVSAVIYTLANGGRDNDQFVIENGELKYQGRDSGDVDKDEPDYLSIRVKSSYVVTTEHTATFNGHVDIDASGNDADSDTRKFSLAGGATSFTDVTERAGVPAIAAQFRLGAAGELNNLIFTANEAGTDGNNIVVDVAISSDAGDAGSGVVSVTVTGTTITLVLRHDGASFDEIKAAIEANADAGALVSIESVGDGAAILDSTNLQTFFSTNEVETLGAEEVVEIPESFRTVTVAGGTIYLEDGKVIVFEEAEIRIDQTSILIVDDEDGDGIYTVRAVTDLPSGEDFYVLATVEPHTVPSVDEVPGIAATNIIAGLVFTAKQVGVAGNQISINVTLNANQESSTDPVIVLVSGDNIEIQFTDGATLQQLFDALAANVDVTALVDFVFADGSTGADLLAAVDATTLSDGVDTIPSISERPGVSPIINTGTEQNGGPLLWQREFTQEHDYIINLNNIDDNGPVFDQPLTGADPYFSITINENDNPGDIYDAHASDADGDDVTYTLSWIGSAPQVNGIDASIDDYFEINAEGGVRVKEGVTFDFEGFANVFDIRVTALSRSTLTVNDAGIAPTGRTATRDLKINIIDVNEAPTGVSIDSDVVRRPEDGSVPADGILIGTLNVADPDAGDTGGFTYEITGDDAALFEIRGDDLYFIGTAAQLRNPGENYAITVTPSDDEGLAGGATDFVFVVSGLFLESADNVRTFTNGGALIEEAADPADPHENAGFAVVMIDHDGDNDATTTEIAAIDLGALGIAGLPAGTSVTYTLVAGDGDVDNSDFVILNGKLYYIGTDSGDADADGGPDVLQARIKASYSLDGGSSTVEEEFSYVLNLENIDDNQPVFEAEDEPHTTSILAPSVEIHGIRFTYIGNDPLVGDNFFIQFFWNEGNGEFEASHITVDGNTGLKLLTSYHRGTPQTPTLEDFINLVNGNLGALDLTGAADRRGDILVRAELVTPGTGKDLFDVQAAVGGVPLVAENSDANQNYGLERPQVIELLTHESLAENSDPANVLFTVAATDADNINSETPNEVITYRLYGSEGDNPLFRINSETGEVFFISTPNFELDNEYEIYIQVVSVSSLGSGSTSTNIIKYTVLLTDTNDAPTGVILSRAALIGGEVEVGDLIAVDEDLIAIQGRTNTDIHGFELVAGDGDDDNALFEIYDNAGTPALRFIGLDGDASQGGDNPGDDGRKQIGESYSVRIRVTDNSGEVVETILTIAEGSIFITNDVDSVHKYSGFVNEFGYGILDENDAGDVNPVLIGRLNDNAGSTYFKLGDDTDEINNDAFEIRQFVTLGETAVTDGLSGIAANDKVFAVFENNAWVIKKGSTVDAGGILLGTVSADGQTVVSEDDVYIGEDSITFITDALVELTFASLDNVNADDFIYVSFSGAGWVLASGDSLPDGGVLLGTVNSAGDAIEIADGVTMPASIASGTITFTGDISFAFGSLLYFTGTDSGDFEGADGANLQTITIKGDKGTEETYVIRLADVNDAPYLKTETQPIPLTEGGRVTLTEDFIGATDQDVADNDEDGNLLGSFTYNVVNVSGGTIERNGVEVTSFTLQEVRDGLIEFVHDGGEQFEQTDGFKNAVERPTSFTLSITDGEATSIERVYSPVITPVNDAPGDTEFSQQFTTLEGRPTILSELHLKTPDVDNTRGEIVYVLSSTPENGRLELFIDHDDDQSTDNIWQPLGVGDTFTQEQINNGHLRYFHNGSETVTDTFQFVVDDSNEDESAPQLRTFQIDITPVNDLPTANPLVNPSNQDEDGNPIDSTLFHDYAQDYKRDRANNPIGDGLVTRDDLAEGGIYVLTANDMGVYDPDSPPAAIIYVIKSLVDTTRAILEYNVGTTELANWVAVSDNDTLTRADLLDGKLRVRDLGTEPTHDGASNRVLTFTYAVKDEADTEGDVSTVELDVKRLNDEPTFLDLGVNRIDPLHTPGTSIATLTTTDEETTDQDLFIYRLIDDPDSDNHYFTIQGRQVILKSVEELKGLGLNGADLLPKNQGEQYVIRIEVTDTATGDATAQTVNRVVFERIIAVRSFDVDWDPATSGVQGASLLEYDLRSDSGELEIGKFVIDAGSNAKTGDTYSVIVSADGNDFLVDYTATQDSIDPTLWTIKITPNADNEVLKSLRAGEVLAKTFTVEVRWHPQDNTDADGFRVTTEQFTVNFIGKNEPPVTVDPNRIIYEDLNEDGEAFGSWDFTDPDTGSRVLARGLLVSAGKDSNTGLAKPPVASDLVIDQAASNYDPNAEVAVDGTYATLYVRADRTLRVVRKDDAIQEVPLTGAEEYFYLALSDRDGLVSDPVEYVFMIEGENDAPELRVNLNVGDPDLSDNDADVSTSVTESTDFGTSHTQISVTAEQTVTGRWLVSDVDSGSSARLFVGAIELGEIDGVNDLTYVGRFGDIVFHANGLFTYTLNARAEKVAAGEDPVETISIRARDEYDAESNIINLAINVEGTNDAPLGFVTIDEADLTVRESGFRPDTAEHDILDYDITNQDVRSLDVPTQSAVPTIEGRVDHDDNDELGRPIITVTLDVRDVDAVGSDGQPFSAVDLHTFEILGGDGVTSRADTVVITDTQSLEATNPRDYDADTQAEVIYTYKGVYGTLTVNRFTGLTTYELDNTDADTIALTEGQEVFDIFTIKITDEEGATVTDTLRIKVVGTNDATLITLENSNLDLLAVEAGGTSNGIAGNTASGTIEFTDDDVDDPSNTKMLSYREVDQDGGGITNWEVASSGFGGHVNNYGTMLLSNLRQFTFTVNQASGHVQALDNGDTVDLYYEFQLRDSSLPYTNVIRVKVTLEGANDAPTLSIVETDLAVTESGYYELGDFSARMELDFDDVDDRDRISNLNVYVGRSLGSQTTALAVSSTQTVNGVGESTSIANGVYGSFIFIRDADGRVRIEYTLTDSAVDTLGGGQTATDKIWVRIEDGGDSDGTKRLSSEVREITVTITGTNDEPTLETQTGPIDLEAALTEDDASVVRVGTFDFGDVDANNANKDLYIRVKASSGSGTGADDAVKRASIEAAVDTHEEIASGGAYIWANNNARTVYGEFGVFTLTRDNNTGKLHVDYQLAKAGLGTSEMNEALKALGEGEIVYESVGIYVDDDNRGGQPGSDVEVVTVTITGTNTAPSLSVTSPSVTIAGIKFTYTGGDATEAEDFFIRFSYETDTSAFAIGHIINGDDHKSLHIRMSGTQTLQQIVDLVNGDPSVRNVYGYGDSRGGNIRISAQLVDENSGGDNFSITAYLREANLVTDQGAFREHAFIAPEVRLTQNEDVDQSVDVGQFLFEDYDSNDGNSTLTVRAKARGDADETTAKEAVDDVAEIGTTDLVFDNNVATVQGAYGTFTLTRDDATGQVTVSYLMDTARVQSLDAGDTVHDVLGFYVNDGTANSDLEQVTVTITGTNDAPTLSEGVNPAATVTEDEGGTVGAGSFDFGDVDADDGNSTLTVRAKASGNADETTAKNAVDSTSDIGLSDINFNGNTATFAGAYGTFTLTRDDATGQISVSYLMDTARVQSLDAGDTVYDVLGLYVNDGTANSAVQQATVTITGTNDAPTLSEGVNPAATVTEDEGGTVGAGSFDFGDVDADDGNSTLTVRAKASGNADETTAKNAVDSTSDIGLSDINFNGNTATFAGAYGTFTLTRDNATGKISVSYDMNTADVQSLDAGDTVYDVLGLYVNDGTANSAVQQAIVTITGTNDDPVVSNSVNSLNEDASVNGNVLAAGKVDDPDDTAHTVTGITGGTVGTALAGTYGTLTLNSDGSYRYDANNAQALRAGQVVTDTFTFTVSDAQGGTDTATLEITITGTNDDPVVSNSVNSLNEDASVNGNVLAGKVTDPDNGDTHELSASSIGEFDGTYGTLSINSAGVYSYVANNAQALRAGQEVTDTFTFTVRDSQGATDTATLVITITGTNDAPTLSAGVNPTATVTEDRTTSVDAGSFDFGDVDSNHPNSGLNLRARASSNAAETTAKAAVDSISDIGNFNINFNGNTAFISTTYGEFTLTRNDTTGEITVDYLLLTSNVQDLNTGDTVYDVLGFYVNDGTANSAVRQVVITITGDTDNFPPVISAASGVLSVEENTATKTTVATVSITDDGDPLSNAEKAIVTSGTGVRLTGDNRFGIEAGSGGTFNIFLKAGQTLNYENPADRSITLTVHSTDSDGETTTREVTIAVTNVNEAATGTPTISGTAAVGEQLTASLGTVADPDHSPLPSYVFEWFHEGAPSTTIGTGATYQVKASDATKKIQVRVVFTSIGGASESRASLPTILVPTPNAVPTVNTADADHEDTGAIQEGDPDNTATGKIVGVDSDGNIASYAVKTQGSYGTTTINADGTWSYELDNGHATIQALNSGASATDTITITITDNDGGTVDHNITITINGRTNINGTSAADASLNGTSADEIIQGGNDNDVITTGGGDDIIIGGYGNDTITLGSGTDTVIYRFASLSNILRSDDGGDTINEFKLGTDKFIFADTDDTAVTSWDDFIDAVQADAGSNIGLIGTFLGGYTGIRISFGLGSKKDGPDGSGEGTLSTFAINFSETFTFIEIESNDKIGTGNYDSATGVLTDTGLDNLVNLFGEDNVASVDVDTLIDIL